MIPRQYVDSLEDIDLEELQRENIQGIICDLDNTLVPWGSDDIADETLQWLQQAGEIFELAMVSNGMAERVEKWAERLSLPAVSRANKPRRGGFRDAIGFLGLSPEVVAVVGDQLFTDVVGGNRMGMYTILVVPLSRREFIGTRLVRLIERTVLYFFNRAGLTRGPKKRGDQ